MFIAKRRRRGTLGRLGSDALTAAFNAANPAQSTDGAAGCWWDYLLGKSAYDACVTKASQAQIQTVPNFAINGGYPANVVAVAGATAAQQEAMVSQDVQNSDAFYDLPASPFIPSFGPVANPGDPSTWPAWAWIVVAIAGGAVLVKLVK